VLKHPELIASPGTGSSRSLQQDLVLLDLETTGASAARDRIIEIGLVHFKRGRVVEQWSTLVDPQTRLSPFIEAYTGIHQAMLVRAPRFAEIAGELRQHLAQGLLVAHNARFDYSFLQHEFARIGETYQAAQLCTVKLSRKLFPAEKRHNLDAIIARHQPHCSNRHRALGDAGVLADFLCDLPRRCPAETIDRAIQSQL
jgi:DNA polymerase-3 subunit epsilon